MTSISNRPLFNLAFQRIRQRPLPYILCIVGIALGVAMMVSIDLANGSAQRAFSLSTDAITGKSTHQITAISAQGIDESVYTALKIKTSPDLDLAPVVEGYVKVSELDNQPLRLVGVDLFAEAPFRSYFAQAEETGQGSNRVSSAEEQSAGNGFVQFLTEPNTVVLSQDLANQYHLQLGDALHLDIAGRSQTVNLLGTIAPSDSLNRRALSNFMFADIATAQELLDYVGKLSQIDVIAQTPEAVTALQQRLPAGLRLETAASQKNAVQQMTAAFELNLTALSLLALVVGMFLIYNTVTFSVIQRRPLFGTLRCLGATRGQIFTLILGEASIFSILGSAIGVGLGILLGRSIVGLITQTINDFYFVVNVQQVTLSNFTIVKGMGIGVVAALVASALPAFEAMNTSPSMTLQRSTLEGKVLQLLPKLVMAWAGLTIAGVALLAWDGAGLVAAFSGLFAILLGAALLVPPLVTACLRVLEPLGEQSLGVLGRLAPRNILRSLSRTSVAVAALMVAVSVIVGVSIMVGSFRGTVVSWLDQTLQADIYVSPPATTANRVLGKLDADVVTALQTFPGVAEAVSYNDADVRVVDYNKTVKLISANGDVSHGKRPYAWIRPDLAPNPWQALDRGEGVIISEALILRENISEPPESITLESPQGNRTFPIIAVFYDYSSDQGTIIIDNDQYEEIWGDREIASLGLFTQPDANVEAVVQSIRETFSNRQTLAVQSNRSLRQDSLEIFDRTFAITNALRLLAVVVAFIGVLSTLMSLQLERTRELGILRATGITPRQLGIMTLLETGLMGTLSGVFAMPLGYALAWILVYVINVRSFGWTLQMVILAKYFWQAGLVAIAAALLAGIYPAWRLGRMNIATAIRQE
jgi:putative ABC transport system permease protein